MSLKILAAALLLALPAACAESLLPKLRIEPTTGGSIFYIRNVSSQPLTAFVIELVDYPGSFFALWQDDITSEAIKPNEEKRLQVSNMTVGAVPDYVKMQAAVYADGTSAGIPEKILQIVARRRFSLQTVRELILRLQAAQESKTSNESLAGSLKRAIEFMVLPPRADKNSQLSINQSAARELYAQTAAHLEKHTLDQTLATLHDWEKALQESKPALAE